MKYVECSIVEVKGGSRFEVALPHPAETNGFYLDIAVLAMPTPATGRPVLRDMSDFDLQVFRKRGSDRFGAKESGPQLPSRVTPAAAPQEACVAGAEIVDLTSRMEPGGVLSWEAPPSHASWTVLRIGFAANGRTNRSASQAGFGLECDKLDPHALDVHFDAYVGRLLKMLPRDRALKGVLIDSYEVFGQNWTRGFDGAFADIAGYSITNFLPVFAGYPVDSAARTDAFLRDFRRAISTVFCRSYPGRMRKRCAEHGLELYCEPYGNGPFNDLEYARECDVPMAEFWRPRDPGCDLAALARERPRTYMECRWGNKALGNGKTIAATAHVWGRRVVGAEAFTSAPDSASGRWLASPFSMKLQCDRVFSEGVNRMIFHRYAHQPWTSPTRYPGMTMAAYGAHLERTQTWWDHGAKEFFSYMSRVQHLLQSGVFVGDVLVCTPGESPEYGTDGEIPEGYDGDRCHPAALLAVRVVEGGAVVVPGGTRYRVVCVPENPSSAVAASAARLASAGAPVVAYGEVAAALEKAGCAPDFLCDDRDATWMHRRAGRDDYYFVSVPNAAPRKVRCSFRDGKGRAPQLWDPVTGGMSSTPFEILSGRTELVLDCTPVHSVFVVFRDVTPDLPECASAKTESVTEVTGPWMVSFCEPGAATNVAVETFEVLSSWTTSSNSDVRYFSGTATYRKRVDIPSGGRVMLDLGDVREIAEVAVNGRTYPALWKPPYRVDITDALAKDAGAADIEIKVTNLWPNRLIGDAALADDCEWDDGTHSKGYPLVKEWPGWLLRCESSPTGRHAFSTCRLWTADAPLLVSGLLGPVRIERQ